METKIAVNDVKCRLEELAGNQLAGGASFRLEHITAVVAELDRLTALCDEYRGEVDALKVENGRLREELGEEEHDISLTDKLAMSESVAEQWMSRAESAESALTRARAEGMEDLACYMIDHCEGDIITEEYLQNTLSDCIKAAEIRAAKGEQ